MAQMRIRGPGSLKQANEVRESPHILEFVLPERGSDKTSEQELHRLTEEGLARVEDSRECNRIRENLGDLGEKKLADNDNRVELSARLYQKFYLN